MQPDLLRRASGAAGVALLSLSLRRLRPRDLGVSRGSAGYLGQDLSARANGRLEIVNTNGAITVDPSDRRRWWCTPSALPMPRRRKAPRTVEEAGDSGRHLQRPRASRIAIARWFSFTAAWKCATPCGCRRTRRSTSATPTADRCHRPDAVRRTSRPPMARSPATLDGESAPRPPMAGSNSRCCRFRRMSTRRRPTAASRCDSVERERGHLGARHQRPHRRRRLVVDEGG